MKKIMTKSILILIILLLAVGSVFMFTACGEIEHGYLPKEDLRFDIDYAKTTLDSVPQVLMTSILSAALDKEESYIELGEKGVFTCILTIDVESVIGLVNTLLGDLNIGELTAGLTKSSLKGTIDGYVKIMFPSFELTNIEDSLKLLSSLGVEIFGLDRSNSEVDKLMDCIENPDSDLLIPADLDITKLPAQIGVKIQGPYKLLDATETRVEDGDESRVWTMATVGPHDNDTIPYMNFFYTVYDNGKETVVWRNEVLGLTVAGIYNPN